MTDFVNNIISQDQSSFPPEPATRTPLEALIALCHHRWSLPIISELHRDNGAKFVTLVNRLQLSRDALSRTLQALQDQQLVNHNPGYGHPLRPEYILTPRGQQLGPTTLELMTALQQTQLEPIALKKWALPIIYTLEPRAMRFNELRALPITARALSLTLKELERAGLLEDAYRLTTQGQRVAAPLKRLVSSL